MALINIETAQRRALQMLKKQPVGAGLELLTYKRNRGVTIIKEDHGLYWVRERGYLEDEWTVTESELPKLLKGILRRECPRSRKVRLYSMNSRDEVGVKRKRL